MSELRVPYVGGPLEYGQDGEQNYELFDTAVDELAEGEVFDVPMHQLDSRNDDVIERYLLTRDDGRWIYRYDGQHERPRPAGEPRHRAIKDVVTHVVGGPSDRGIVVIDRMDVERPELYDNPQYRRRRFSEEVADQYTLRHTAEGWQWHWTGPDQDRSRNEAGQ